MKLCPSCTSLTKINSKWNKNLNVSVRPEAVKLLEENREKLLDIGICSDFLNMTLIVQAPKPKINK